MEYDEIGHGYLEVLLEIGITSILSDIDWIEIACDPDISLELLEKYHNQVPWTHVALRPGLPEAFILKWKDRLDWSDISRFQDLDEDFMWRHYDKLDWDSVCQFQTLSEDFITYLDYNGIPINWEYIHMFQKHVSKAFQDHVLTKLNYEY